MTFKTKLMAAALCAAFVGGASAVPLVGLAGNLQWKLAGLTTEDNTLAGSNESTWGIGEVTQILGATSWSRGEGGDYLYYVLYGIADLNVTPGGTFGNNIYNIGCTGGGCDGNIYIDVYRHTSEWVNPADFKSLLTSDRLGFNGYKGISDGGDELYLRLQFDQGKCLDDGATAEDESTCTLYQSATAATLPAFGSGTFFASAVAGAAMDKWNTNGQNGGNSDFDAKFTLGQNEACVDLGGVDCFLGDINDPVKSFAIPEPASLGLVGLALLGAGIGSRRRKG